MKCFAAIEFPSLGTPELMLTAILVLVLFSAKKLPEFGRAFRRSLGDFLKAKEDFQRELEREPVSHAFGAGGTLAALFILGLALAFAIGTVVVWCLGK